jgi:hypothetical protein
MSFGQSFLPKIHVFGMGATGYAGCDRSSYQPVASKTARKTDVRLTVVQVNSQDRSRQGIAGKPGAGRVINGPDLARRLVKSGLR